MQHAAMKRSRPSGSAAGFTFIEMILASVILAMMIFAVATLSVSGAEAQEYARRLTRATEITQHIVDDMRLELISSVRMFGTDAEGTGNRAVLDLDGVPVPLGNIRLPTIDSNGSIRQDTAGDQITGNTLFFAKLAWSDRFVCPSGNEYMVDVLRWVYYYPTAEGGGPTAGSAIGLNLVRVVSEPLVDGAAIDRITNVADQQQVLLHLVAATPDASGNAHAPCQVVWQRGGLPAVAGTFRQINPGDGTLSTTPLVATGRPNPWQILRMDGAANGMLSYRHHSVATNFSRPSFGVGQFAVQSATGDGFPHGFETQVTGPSSARQVLLKLVIASTNRHGHTAWSNVQMVVDARDL